MRTLKPDREARFRALYADAYADVLAFAQRRGHPSHAEDVAAEAFLVVWRRFDQAPRRPDEVRAWIFGIARNCLLNAQRGSGRRDALAVRIATLSPVPGGEHDDDTVALLDLAAAWKRLTPAEQETLSLNVFEELTSAQAARVLGISGAGYRIRLMRARRSLRRHLDPRPADEQPKNAQSANPGPANTQPDDTRPANAQPANDQRAPAHPLRHQGTATSPRPVDDAMMEAQP
ncbi:RNA polymerase sigma factor [Actinoplanes bogorensis]|uniref:RNA polymerase sigma factor n=1 Tax=Paractinoplanes bogorensis TaxID=1610840 RepID=A0ABS5YQV6_9ACTN|nr:RNA polymerase sigma factor [Actinoplanes bogorensis]MBU2665103.1 RNA polymerase sigma factor [Actinoplanes bogorensis]